MKTGELVLSESLKRVGERRFNSTIMRADFFWGGGLRRPEYFCILEGENG